MCCTCHPNIKTIVGHNIKDKAIFVNKLKELAKESLSTSLNVENHSADLIIYGGNIITAEDSRPEVEAIAILGEKIIAIGNLDFVMKHFKRDSTQLLNLHGKTLTPGFIDPHMHLSGRAMVANFIDISSFKYKTSQEIQKEIQHHVKQSVANDWITFRGIDPTLIEGTIDLSLKALDKIAPNNPLLIMHDSGHMAYVNSIAFKKANITNKTPSPQGGEFIKDSKGELTGLIIEEPALLFFIKNAIKITPEQYIQGMIDILHLANQAGCTSIHDAALGMLDLGAEISAINVAIAKNPSMRISAFIFTHNLEEVKNAIKLYTPEYKKKYFRIIGLKAVVDGSTQIGTAAYHESYLKSEYGTGHPNYKQEDLNKMVVFANKQNWQYGLHANGDLAIDMALKAFEESHIQNKKNHLRNRIEHCSICNDDQFAKMSDVGVSPTFLISHLYYWGHVFSDLIGKKRANLLDGCNNALKHNLKISLHSDYPVSPISPIMSMHIAVNRQVINSSSIINKAECITALEALKAVTINAAWQCQTEDITGSIAVGKLADFIILDHSPLDVDKSEIKNIQVLETWVGGKKVYKKSNI